MIWKLNKASKYENIALSLSQEEKVYSQCPSSGLTFLRKYRVFFYIIISNVLILVTLCAIKQTKVVKSTKNQICIS